MSRHCKHRLQKLCNSPSAQRRGKRLAARAGRERALAESLSPKLAATSGLLAPPLLGKPAAEAAAEAQAAGERRSRRGRYGCGARARSASSSPGSRRRPCCGRRQRAALLGIFTAPPPGRPPARYLYIHTERESPFLLGLAGVGRQRRRTVPASLPSACRGDGSPAAPSEATRARLAPALVICASLSRSVSLCNPQGLAPRLVPSLRRRRRGRRGRRAVAVAAARDGACQRAAPRPPGGRLCSGGGRARAPSASTGPALSPPLPRQARARRRAADRGQGAGTARPARLRNFALRSGWHSRPRGLPRLPARRPPWPAPLGPALPPPARPAPSAADWLLGTLIAPPPGTGGGRESEPSESEALRRGDFFSILFFFFPFWSDLGRRQSNNSKRLPQNRWG